MILAVSKSFSAILSPVAHKPTHIFKAHHINYCNA